MIFIEVYFIRVPLAHPSTHHTSNCDHTIQTVEQEKNVTGYIRKEIFCGTLKHCIYY